MRIYDAPTAALYVSLIIGNCLDHHRSVTKSLTFNSPALIRRLFKVVEENVRSFLDGLYLRGMLGTALK